MEQDIKERISILLKQEADIILHSDREMSEKLQDINVIFNLQQILNHYNELEPVLIKFFAERKEKSKEDE